MSKKRTAFLVLSFGLVVGCTSSEPGGSTGTGGSPSTGGTTGTGGMTGTGGTTSTGGSTGTGGTGTGGTGTGGTPSTGGTTGTGGTAGTSGIGGKAGAGATGTGGVGGSGSGTGGSIVTGTPKPSPGCGKSGRPSGGMAQVANTSLYMFPTTYDGTKPFPLLIALHACGNANTEFVNLTNNTGFATDYVRSFPNTPDSGQCWSGSNYSGDSSRILSQYDEVVNNYCIDENRVFAMAHSSGAQMLVNLLAHKSDAQHLNLKGVSPVAADPYNVALPMPVLYIDGQHDTERSANSATDAVARFRTANMCASTSKAYSAVATCMSTDSGHPLVTPGCIIYDSCTVPTIWCSHNDPSYSGTEHGVPCFAMKAMYDFFAGLP